VGWTLSAKSRTLFRVLLFLGASVGSLAGDRTISRAAAESLVRAALAAMGETPNSFHVERWAYGVAPEFYNFQAWRPHPADGPAPLINYYFSVNRRTGDVWDAMACTRITSSTLSARQSAIRARSGLPAPVLEALRQKSPDNCEEWGKRRKDQN
jgi:hypothetical protein